MRNRVRPSALQPLYHLGGVLGRVPFCEDIVVVLLREYYNDMIREVLELEADGQDGVEEVISILKERRDSIPEAYRPVDVGIDVSDY